MNCVLQIVFVFKHQSTPKWKSKMGSGNIWQKTQNDKKKTEKIHITEKKKKDKQLDKTGGKLPTVLLIQSSQLKSFRTSDFTCVLMRKKERVISNTGRFFASIVIGLSLFFLYIIQSDIPRHDVYGYMIADYGTNCSHRYS